MGDGVFHGGAEGLAQALAALFAALWRQAGQPWREMIVADYDDPDGWRR
jgi:hypothetical protein